jgi:cellulose synthase/poly-beta-1,6-N-acetylglucosamine synthase-like glycosyltransferase
MGQRKRWINGSWFAFQYVFSHKSERLTCLFLIQLINYWFVEKVSYLSLCIFYISLNLTITSSVREYVVPAVKRFFGAVNDW